MEQTRYYNTSTDLARLLSREEMVILLVNWIGTRAPSETSGKKRKRTKRKSRFFSSGKIENYVRTKRMKIRVEAEMVWIERNRRLDLSFPHLLAHDSSYGMDGQRNARRCVVYGLFILSSLSVGKKRRKEVEQYQRKLFVFKQLYERYLMVEIFLLPFYLG